jgi:hypothetical protein
MVPPPACSKHRSFGCAPNRLSVRDARRSGVELTLGIVPPPWSGAAPFVGDDLQMAAASWRGGGRAGWLAF